MPKNEKTRKMCTRNTKSHKMNLREKEHYLIKKAKTERLKKSALLHMTRQLNKQEEDNRRIFKI